MFLYSRICRLCFQHPLAPQLPTFLQQLVYEKEKRLRMMMKMHGLGDGAYWLITYTWWGGKVTLHQPGLGKSLGCTYVLCTK